MVRITDVEIGARNEVGASRLAREGDHLVGIAKTDQPFFAPQAYRFFPELYALSGRKPQTERTIDGRLIGPEYEGRRLNFAQFSAAVLRKLVEAAAAKGIREQDVAKALFEGRFKPALKDLRIAYEGLALPSPGRPFATTREVKAERGAKWTRRFGSFGELGWTGAPPNPTYASLAASLTEDPDAWDSQSPSDKDLFLLQTAINLKDPAWCETINPKAEYSLGFNPEGFRGHYAKSACYEEVALVTQQRELCLKVVPQTFFLRDGRQYSKEHCEKQVLEYPDRGEVRLSGDEMPMLKAAGYSLSEVGRFKTWSGDRSPKLPHVVAGYLENASEEEQPYRRFYICLIAEASDGERAEFQRRILAVDNSFVARPANR